MQKERGMKTLTKTLSLAALLALLIGAVALVSEAGAAPRTVSLAVDNMTCASCPIIVGKALRQVPGVEHAAVSLEDKTAKVTFDDAQTSISALTEATTSAGFPSRLLP
jgi:mercuric ion binding protein